MEARRRTWFDERGIALEPEAGARRVPFYAASLPYWRVAPIRWGAELRALHAQGFTIIDTFVPWRVHEPEAGERLWSGERDLARFLEAARAAGLYVVLRPGPQMNAELAGFGIPDFVLADPICQAQTASGTTAWMPSPPRAFPIPSYASFAFQAHVKAWFAQVGEIVRPFLAPDGPVIAIAVDGQSPHVLRTGAFDLDYHADAVAWWSEASGLDEPPRTWSPSDAARCALWLKFKDEYLARAFAAFGKSLDAAGLGELARFHDVAPGHYQHHDLRQLQRAIGGPVGIGAYTRRADFPELRRRAASLVGNAAPIPLAPSVGVGGMLWLPPLDDADDATRERDQLLTLLAAGVRGFSVYAHPASPSEGQPPWLKSLLAALAEVDWLSLRRSAPIAILDTRSDARFGVLSNLVDPVTPVIADALSLGPGGAAELGTDDGAIAARRWQSALARALELAQVPYAIVDEAAPEEELARYRAVLAPTLDRIDRGLFTRLRALVEHKRAIVVVGPGTPTRDELDQPLADPLPKRVGKLKAGSLEDLPGLAEDLAALVADLPEIWHVERPDDVRAFAHADASGVVRVVFVASDADRATTAVLVADGKALRDPIANETFAVTGGRASIPMPARGVRMLIAE